MGNSGFASLFCLERCYVCTYPSGTRSLLLGEDLGSDAPMISSTIGNWFIGLKIEVSVSCLSLADISD